MKESNRKAYEVAKSDQGDLILGLAIDFDTQAVLLVQKNLDTGGLDAVALSMPMLNAAMGLIRLHTDENGNLVDPNKEKVVAH